MSSDPGLYKNSMKSFFERFSILPADKIFQLNQDFITDQRKNKVNGGIGVYLDEKGKPFVLPVVKKTIKILDNSNYNYLPISGDLEFLNETGKLVLGEKLWIKTEKEMVKQGVMGGTNGLFLWGSLVKLVIKKPKILIGDPTWENHKKIFKYLGFEIIEYEHLDNKEKINLSVFKKALKNNPGTFVLLHGGSTHNPTGINPNKEEWLEMAKVIKKTGNNVCFDFAYMGLGENIDDDSFPIRLFIRENILTSVIVSFSKNMTLYQHRTGALFMFTSSESDKNKIESNVKYLFRIINSNPSALGQLIVKHILLNEELKNEWLSSLKEMINSLYKRRKMFVEKSGKRFKAVLNQKGLFSLLNLNKEEILILRKEHGIYLLDNSRINFGGIALSDIPYVAQKINEVTIS